MWRYRSVLPEVAPVTLGEGWTPVIRSKRYPNVFVKEEGANPTGSFKARGLALAVTMAKHYGLKKLAVPSAGNAAGALAAAAPMAGARMPPESMEKMLKLEIDAIVTLLRQGEAAQVDLDLGGTGVGIDQVVTARAGSSRASRSTGRWA